jgi:hypothetical protein
MDLGAHLADQDIASQHRLATEALDAPALGVTVSTVF